MYMYMYYVLCIMYMYMYMYMCVYVYGGRSWVSTTAETAVNGCSLGHPQSPSEQTSHVCSIP